MESACTVFVANLEKVQGAIREQFNAKQKIFNQVVREEQEADSNIRQLWEKTFKPEPDNLVYEGVFGLDIPNLGSGLSNNLVPGEIINAINTTGPITYAPTAALQFETKNAIAEYNSRLEEAKVAANLYQETITKLAQESQKNEIADREIRKLAQKIEELQRREIKIKDIEAQMGYLEQQKNILQQKTNEAKLARDRYLQLQKLQKEYFELNDNRENVLLKIRTDVQEQKDESNKESVATRAKRRACYTFRQEQMRETKEVVGRLINHIDITLKTLFARYIDLMQNFCAKPKPAASVPQPPKPAKKPIKPSKIIEGNFEIIHHMQAISSIDRFLTDVNNFLQVQNGPLDSFDFCTLSAPSNPKKLTPWQNFAENLSQKSVRVELAAGQTGAGKTYFAFKALTSIIWALAATRLRRQISKKEGKEGKESKEVNWLPESALILVPASIFSQWFVQLSELADNPLFKYLDKKGDYVLQLAHQSGEGNRYAIVDLQVTKKTKAKASEGKGRDAKGVLREPFRIHLQSIGYSFPTKKDTVKRYEFNPRVPDLRKDNNIFVIADEYHKTVFFETSEEEEYALEHGTLGGVEMKKVFNQIGLALLEFAIHQLANTASRSRFLALTATPLTYDTQNPVPYVKDTLRALLPFRIALKSGIPIPEINLKNENQSNANVTTVINRMLSQVADLKDPYAVSLLYQQMASGYMSYTNYDRCFFMPSFATPCTSGEICEYRKRKGKYTLEEVNRWPISERTNPNIWIPKSTDFTPVIVPSFTHKNNNRSDEDSDNSDDENDGSDEEEEERKKPIKKNSKKAGSSKAKKKTEPQSKGIKKGISAVGGTEYYLKLKSQAIIDVLNQYHPNDSALIYAPCDRSINSYVTECVASVARELSEATRSVILWPSELAKTTKRSQELKERNEKLGFTMSSFKSLLEELVNARNSTNRNNGATYLATIRKYLKGRPCVFVYGYIKGSLTVKGSVYSGKELNDNLKAMQFCIMEAFTAQSTENAPKALGGDDFESFEAGVKREGIKGGEAKRGDATATQILKRTILHIVAQVSTGLDAAGANVIFSTVPVPPGPVAVQLLGRIKRLSGANGGAYHGKLRAYQLIVEDSDEEKMYRKYIEKRDDFDKVAVDPLSIVAIDELYFSRTRGAAASAVANPVANPVALATAGLGVSNAGKQESKQLTPPKPPTELRALANAVVEKAQALYHNSELYREMIIEEIKQLARSKSIAAAPENNLNIKSETKIKTETGTEMKTKTENESKSNDATATEKDKRKKWPRLLSELSDYTDFFPEYMELINPNLRKATLKHILEVQQWMNKPQTEYMMPATYKNLAKNNDLSLLEIHENNFVDRQSTIGAKIKYEDEREFFDVIEEAIRVGDWALAFGTAYLQETRGGDGDGDEELNNKIKESLKQSMDVTDPVTLKRTRNSVNIQLANLSLEDVQDLADNLGKSVENIFAVLRSQYVDCPF